jgi:hypothetical protein
MLTGRCLCGNVRYEIDGALRHITHCHCGMCRRGHGAAFATYAMLRRDRIRVTGEDALRGYRSSERVLRESCATCGSPMFWRHDDYPTTISVAIGTLDGDPIGRPTAHIFWGSRACWLELDDALPKHEIDLPAGT